MVEGEVSVLVQLLRCHFGKLVDGHGMQISAEYWDSILTARKHSAKIELWRFPIYEQYDRLINQWCKTHHISYALKTDLFEEATAPPGLVGLCERKVGHLVGIDHSFECISQARRKLNDASAQRILFVCCDIRHLPFKPYAFDLVISNSTLDHFTAKKCVIKSLQEI